MLTCMSLFSTQNGYMDKARSAESRQLTVSRIGTSFPFCSFLFPDGAVRLFCLQLWNYQVVSKASLSLCVGRCVCVCVCVLKSCFPTAGTGEGSLCSIFSPSFVQWEAMTFFLESVINQMFRTLDKEVSNCFPCWLCHDFDLFKTGRVIEKSVDVHPTEEETEIQEG